MSARRVGPVVVGIDGSANARRALVAAAKIADATGAELIVVHAVGLTEEIDGDRVPSKGHRPDIVALVDEWCAAAFGADDADAEADKRIVDGSPADVIDRIACREDASMIVVGRRGAGRRPDLMLGSTAHQVVEQGRFPTLVIPPIGHSATVRPAGE